MKTFYEHLVEIDFLHTELNSLDLKPEEKKELLTHVHSSIHYTVLGVVLSELPEKDKEIFIEHLKHERHSELWQHLLENTQGIEEKIRDSARAIAHEFISEIHKAKEK